MEEKMLKFINIGQQSPKKEILLNEKGLSKYIKYVQEN